MSQEPWQPPPCVWEVSKLDRRDRELLAEKPPGPFAAFALDVEHARDAHRASGTARRPVSVVTYANGGGGWFPYFYRHYSRQVGPEAIYVLTPRPEEFSQYRLGGIIGLVHMSFDDDAKSVLLGHVASGLQAMYGWTLVADVDEIVVPHPRLGVDLTTFLSQRTENILLSRGFDVLQNHGEADFDFDKPVLEQRRLGVPNTALCKPHLARVPLRYSGGHHYCDRKLDFAPKGDGIVTLHLKWACRNVRREVGALVARTRYRHDAIAQYSARSVADETVHPALVGGQHAHLEPLDGSAMDRFEEQYVSNVAFEARRWLYVGKHVVAPFVVDLLS